MNISVVVIFFLFIASVYANFNITLQSPNVTISPISQQFIFQITQPVNPPTFQSFIHINNATSNATVYQIDVHLNTTNITYSNDALTFYLPGFNMTGEFYITFDEGVLFSNNPLNSTAQTDPHFWHLTVINLDTTTSATSVLANTSTGTTYSGTTEFSTTYSGTSAVTMTTVTLTYTSMNQTTQHPITTITTPAQAITGEPPPTRSAQIGMGLGITFITIIIIGEIIYFKYCYNGSGRNNNYYP